MDIRYSEMLKWFQHNHPDQIWRYVESVSPNQLKSKFAIFKAIEEKQIVFPRDEDGKINVEIIGGWFGWPLIGMLIDLLGDDLNRIDFFELDPFACKVLHKYIDVMKPIVDIRIFEMNWFNYKETRRSHVIINTSCEHMPDLISQKQYFISPERTLLILTSNDKTNEPDHVNCKKTEQQLCEDNGCRMLAGDCLKMPGYKRFISIGKWT